MDKDIKRIYQSISEDINDTNDWPWEEFTSWNDLQDHLDSSGVYSKTMRSGEGLSGRGWVLTHDDGNLIFRTKEKAVRVPDNMISTAIGMILDLVGDEIDPESGLTGPDNEQYFNR